MTTPMTAFKDEDTLIQALIDKSETAFRHALTECQPSMLYLAHSMVGNKLADEVVQEAWFSAMRALPKFERRSKLKTWLMRIVANEAKTRLRRENRQVSLDVMLEPDDTMDSRFDSKGHWQNNPLDWDGDSPEALLSSDELLDCIDDMIATLPDLQSATLNLRERQGYSLVEICNILDVSESNVRVLLHRARNRVFRCIEHFQDSGECCTI
jgi:RNA polymerase sigma-70 factor (ECF subfamily)